MNISNKKLKKFKKIVKENKRLFSKLIIFQQIQVILQ